MTDLDEHCKARTREARNDPRTTHEFVTIALTEPDEDRLGKPYGFSIFEVRETCLRRLAGSAPASVHRSERWGRTSSGSWESLIELSPRKRGRPCATCWALKPMKTFLTLPVSPWAIPQIRLRLLRSFDLRLTRVRDCDSQSRSH